MNIEHIVLSGGGPVGFIQCSSINYLLNKNMIDLNKIKSIYAVSAGIFTAIAIALKYDFNDIVKYQVERPWEKIFEIKPSNAIYNIITKNGIYDNESFENIISPILLAKDINISITLIELYEKTNVDLHIITTNINTLEMVDINHISHPDYKLLEIIHMTCCIPLLFTPIFKDDTFFLDGGITNNFPLDLCIKNNNLDNTDTILAYKNLIDTNYYNGLKSDSQLVDIIMFLIKKLACMLCYKNQSTVKYIVNIPTPGMSYNTLIKLLNKDDRSKLMKDGVDYTKLFLEYHKLF